MLLRRLAIILELVASTGMHTLARFVEVREIHSMHTTYILYYAYRGVLGSYCTIRSTTSRMHKNSYMVWHMHTEYVEISVRL